MVQKLLVTFVVSLSLLGLVNAVPTAPSCPQDVGYVDENTAYVTQYYWPPTNTYTMPYLLLTPLETLNITNFKFIYNRRSPSQPADWITLNNIPTIVNTRYYASQPVMIAPWVVFTQALTFDITAYYQVWGRKAGDSSAKVIYCTSLVLPH